MMFRKDIDGIFNKLIFPPVYLDGERIDYYDFSISLSEEAKIEPIIFPEEVRFRKINHERAHGFLELDDNNFDEEVIKDCALTFLREGLPVLPGDGKEYEIHILRSPYLKNTDFRELIYNAVMFVYDEIFLYKHYHGENWKEKFKENYEKNMLSSTPF